MPRFDSYILDDNITGAERFLIRDENGDTKNIVLNQISSFTTSLFVESDPVFSASPASGITGTQITNWDTAFGWGDHAAAGYLSSSSISTDLNMNGNDIINVEQVRFNGTTSNPPNNREISFKQDENIFKYKDGFGNVEVFASRSWVLSQGYLTSFVETNDLSSVVTWVNVPDENITSSSVQQHFGTNLTSIFNLSDPNVDSILFWDDSLGGFTHLSLGTNLTITGTTLNATGGVDTGSDYIWGGTHQFDTIVEIGSGSSDAFLFIEPNDLSLARSNYNRLGFRTGNVFELGTAGAAGQNLRLDYDAITVNRELIFTDSDITYNGTSLLSGTGGDLWTDPVDTDILPDGNNTRSIGTIGNSFLAMYANSFVGGEFNGNGINLLGGGWSGSGTQLVSVLNSGDFAPLSLDDSSIPAAASATNYTPSAATVEGHLEGIDAALGTGGGLTTDQLNRLLNENKYIRVLKSSNGTLTTEDIEISSGVDIGKKPFVEPSGVGLTIRQTLGNIGVNGEDSINFRGNILQATSVLEVVPDSGITFLNLPSGNAFTVTNGELAVATKMSATQWRIDGSFTAITADLTAPTVTSATVENADPDVLVVVFDENVTFTNTTGLSLDGSWTGITINSIASGNGTNTITFALSGAIANGETGNFVYSGSNNGVDNSGNALAAGSTAVTNNVSGGITNNYSSANALNTGANEVNSNADFDPDGVWIGANVITSDVSEGTYALEFVRASQTFDQFRHQFPQTENVLLNITFDIWVVSGTVQNGTIRDGNGVGSTFPITIPAGASSGYTQVSVNYTLPVGGNEVDIRIPINGTTRLDNMVVIEN